MAKYICIECLKHPGIGMCHEGRVVEIEKTGRRERRLEYGIKRMHSDEIKDFWHKWWLLFSRKDLEKHFKPIKE